MPFDEATLEKYLEGIPETDRKTARDLLSDPKKIAGYISSHKTANNEAMVSRQNLSALMKATGIELTPAEQKELATHMTTIFPDGKFDPEAYSSVLSELGVVDLVNDGEIDPDEIGMIQDKQTGEISVDMDDGEIYHDDDGNLVDGNGFYVDEDNEYSEEPIHMDNVQGESHRDSLEAENADLDQRIAALDQREAQIKLEQKLIRHGVDPEAVSDFAKIYPAFKTEDGNEATDDQITQHFSELKANSRYSGFFSGTQSPNILPSGGRVGGASSTSEIQYQAAKTKGDIQGMLSKNQKYAVNSSAASAVNQHTLPTAIKKE